MAQGPGFGTNFTLACPYTLLAHYHELDWAASCGVEASLVRVWVGLDPPEHLLEVFGSALDAAAVRSCFIACLLVPLWMSRVCVAQRLLAAICVFVGCDGFALRRAGGDGCGAEGVAGAAAQHEGVLRAAPRPGAPGPLVRGGEVAPAPKPHCARCPKLQNSYVHSALYC